MALKKHKKISFKLRDFKKEKFPLNFKNKTEQTPGYNSSCVTVANTTSPITN